MNSLVLLLLMVLPFGSQPEGILDRAIELFGNGEYGKANDLLSTTGDSANDSAEIKFWLGKSFLKLRKWDKAVSEFEKAVKIEPSNARYRLWLGRAYGSRAENSFIGFTDARRVIREFKKAGELDPENISIRFDLLEFYAQAPGIVGGGKDKAWAEAELISKLKPVRGYTARATIYEREERWELAEKEYTQATVDYPSDTDAHKDLAQFFFDRKNYKRALASARKALELNSTSNQSRYILAVSLIKLGQDPDKAREILLDLTGEPLGDASPSFEDVYYWLGVCYFVNGEREKSQDAFESALVYNPDYKKAKNYLKIVK
ncbi:MAG: tetratricopeptide repeat protein [Acidobacteria bacterium]|nr:tetratricopeptide repeat protein [Acidobacteriota bacterium]